MRHDEPGTHRLRGIRSLTNVQASRRKCNGFLFGLNFGLAALGRQTT